MGLAELEKQGRLGARKPVALVLVPTVKDKAGDSFRLTRMGALGKTRGSEPGENSEGL